MVPFGTVTVIVMARFDTVQLHRSGADAFLSVPFYDMIVFGVLIVLAIYWRTKPELHRRLNFIATCGSWTRPLAALTTCSTTVSCTRRCVEVLRLRSA
jgi:hypothetical protein